MIISPPLLAERIDTENDADWVNRMMPADPQRNFPVNEGQSWHGGIHLTSSSSDPVRCVADGKIISLRQPDPTAREIPPLNYNGATDNGYVLLKHETEIGSGESGKIVWYSLYIHLNTIDSSVVPGKTLYRKAPTVRLVWSMAKRRFIFRFSVTMKIFKKSREEHRLIPT